MTEADDAIQSFLRWGEFNKLMNSFFVEATSRSSLNHCHEKLSVCALFKRLKSLFLGFSLKDSKPVFFIQNFDQRINVIIC